MTRPLIIGGILAAILSAISIILLNSSPDETRVPFEPPSRVIEAASLCPWREPEADLKQFFSQLNPTRYDTETRILSGLRGELQMQLGHPPEAEDNALVLYRIYHDLQPIGMVMTRRVKGENGAIEIVLAVTEDSKISGVRFQRLREPIFIATALQSDAWLEKFYGRTRTNNWSEEDLVNLPPECRISAASIREGIRSLLILLSVSEGPGVPATPRPHH
jgi:hypothetical protein